MSSNAKKSIHQKSASTHSKILTSKTAQQANESQQNPKHAKNAPDSYPRTDIHHLQRTIGNRKISSLLGTKNPIQTKLTVGPANDKYEQEADLVAKKVVKQINSPSAQQPVQSFSSPTAQRQGPEEEELQAKPVQRQEEEEELLQGKSIQRQPEEDEELLQGKFLQRQPEEDEELLQGKFLRRQPEEEEELLQGKFETGRIQRQEEEEELMAKPEIQNQSQEGGVASSELEASIQQERGSGMPLPDTVRGPVEKQLGADFSRVRVHTGTQSENLNRSMQSRAFTTGKDIFFRQGEYNPGSTNGKELLAHELTHTLQQGASTRISRWAPTGHRKITGIAFKDETLDGLYDEDTKKILIDRAPDMDYVQDQQDDMGSGMEESDVKIKQYKKDAKKLKKMMHRLKHLKGGKEKDDLQEKINKEKWKLDNMWKKNKLHTRPPDYMRLHGEGGLYKIPAENAASYNRAITKNLVDKAIALYKEGKSKKAIEILGDAIHQAEDRGSHGEGGQGKGHDARLKIKLKHRAPDHDNEMDGVEFIPYKKNCGYPDNSDKNKEGAQVAVGFAQSVLHRFASGAGMEEEAIHAEKPITRHAKILEQETTSKGVATWIGEILWPGLWTGKFVKKLKPVNWKSTSKGKYGLGASAEAELEKARSTERYYLQGIIKQSVSDLKRKPVELTNTEILNRILNSFPANMHAEVTQLVNQALEE